MSDEMTPSVAADARPRLAQIAMSVPDLPAAVHFYQDILGFRVTAMRTYFQTDRARQLLGMPCDVSLTLCFLVGRQEFFQLELLAFSQPHPRPMPTDWRASDTGYTRLGIAVPDFEATFERLFAAGRVAVTAPVVRDGLRRACVRDPAGSIVEIMEDGPGLPGGSAPARWPLEPAAKYITASVPDRGKAERYFIDTFGLERDDETELHSDEDEGLWGLDGPKRTSCLARADDMFIEIVEYAAPKPRPWRQGHLLSDIGLLNLAIGWHELEPFQLAYDRAEAAGHELAVDRDQALHGPNNAVAYVTDDQGFSVEFFALPPDLLAERGFVPPQPAG